jgi:ribosome-associated protein
MSPDNDHILVRPGFVIPAQELRFTYARSSGPGGQKVNKTSTKVRLEWKPAASTAAAGALSEAERERLLARAGPSLTESGVVQIVSDRHRSREANRRECGRKLAEMVRKWLRRPRKRIPTSPTSASREKRLRQKTLRSRIKRGRGRPKEE